MLRVFEDSGFEVSHSDEGGEIRVEFPIRSDERYREAVDLRDHTAVGPSLRPVLEPTSVAVVGASAREASIGGAVFRNILEAGYTGAVFPVNRSGEPVAGHPAHASVAGLPMPIDLAVIAVPSGAVQSAVAEALCAGAKAVCVISAGFAETGPGRSTGRGRPARTRPLARRAHGRAELPRRVRRRARAERDVRAPPVRAGERRDLVAERRRRPGGDR